MPGLGRAGFERGLESGLGFGGQRPWGFEKKPKNLTFFERCVGPGQAPRAFHHAEWFWNRAGGDVDGMEWAVFTHAATPAKYDERRLSGGAKRGTL